MRVSQLLFLSVILYGQGLFAYVERIGLFIGNNEGVSGEAPLKYAVEDARKMARVFQDASHFEKDRIYLLENPKISSVREALSEISGRIKELKKDKTRVQFLLFFSGHGSAEAIHINGTKMLKAELDQKMERLGADLKILIVDACESGHLLRSKGGQVIDNHKIETVDELQNKGTILLSSSSRGELAQESENYKGAIFTHHMVNGLRGMADYDNNDEISLWEAYHYANISTRRENIQGKLGQQNPNFDFDVVGKSDVILSVLSKKKSRILFKEFRNTVMEVRDAATMNLEARIFLSGTDSAYFSLPSKEYILTYEEGKKFKATKANLTWNNRYIATPGEFHTLAKSEVYRKGGRAFNLDPHAMHYGFFRTRIGPSEAVNMVSGYYEIRRYHYQQSLGIAWGMGTSKGELLTNEMNTLRLSYCIERPFARYRLGQFLAGVDAGWYGVWQKVVDNRFNDSEVNPYAEDIKKVRRYFTNIYELGFPVSKEFFLPYGFTLAFTGHSSLFLFKDANTGYSSRLNFRPVIAAGYRF
ncbi:MAG: caspase family protein [Fibrobacteria bacterium]|nr:caspase family protein [Fibrobacteria bacterium]